ncbi:carboxypeptidase regulatory-like domain-containing protein [uncultured Paraglaciecola sp.]|uniref:carboxypeptidase regulatory-like domain-containing protein n=1 Tax=uncultured Paraglaciecola sp. TaxID=1765024 RepID=UPI0026330BFA|nr:carboxypeptidase regulatory-like domain-containing protein [uncultured Paraglaciecola sp.]
MGKITFRKSITALAVVASLGMSVAAFAADTGGLKIRVTDSSGSPVAGATVLVKTPDSLTSKEAVSDAEGNVRLVGLDPSNKYEVAIEGAGYSPFVADNVRVVTGKSLNLNYVVYSGDMETIEVSARQIAALDTTSSSVGLDITLDMTESLPTQRSYQSYLQLVPGVKPSAGNNPSSKSGVNYSDIPDPKTGSAGSSSDNVYYIDGVNVTDNSTGTFGANFNSEIIQEQQIITGGVAAKYAGGAGLVSRVTTKSGSNEFHGSVNYYMQNDSLVGDYKSDSISETGFKNFDTAVTFGGPIIKDKLWFFTSYQIKNEKSDVADPETGQVSRSVEREEKLGFAKLTWQATDDDRLTLTYFNDPTEISGSDDFNRLNNRDRARNQGGDNFKVDYVHSWDDVILSAGYMDHEGELSDIAADQSTRNDVAFFGGNPSQSQQDTGGLGADTLRFRNKQGAYINLEYFLYTDFGDHTIEFGYENETNENISNSVYSGEGAQYTSIASQNSGVTLDEYTAGGWTGARDVATADYERIIEAMGNSGEGAYYVGLLDTDSDGVISNAELGALTFNSSAGNPGGQINNYRIVQTQQAESKMETKGQVLYAQDSWTLDNLTVIGGVRAEKWEHYASTGAKIFTFDWEYAPRLSVVYDIHGDGESKVWGFTGRYYDPVRTNMTSFAGNLTGSVREEQIFVEDRWLTFRERGGVGTQDAFFSPSTKTPYTDELMFGYSQNLTDDISITGTYTKRETKNILEDYDLGLYDEEGDYAGSWLELPLEYFGYTERPASNYVIGTLAGGIRKYQGYELSLRKHRANDNWQLLASLTHNKAEGNSNSDSNADYQGDWSVLDPRAPNQYGNQPGNIKNQFKAAGTYFFDNGIEVGAVYNWNSGVAYSETQLIGGRHLPIMDAAYDYNGFVDTWISEGAVGSHTTPSYGVLDLRVKYSMEFNDTYKAEFFLDVFNALDNQAVIREQDLYAGGGEFAFGEAMGWVEPRRFYLGARLSF